MRQISFIFPLIFAFNTLTQERINASTIIEPALSERLKKSKQNEKIPIIIALLPQIDEESLKIISYNKGKTERKSLIISELKRFHSLTQRKLLEFLQREEKRGNIEDINPYWIVNAISCNATRDVIYEMKENKLLDIWFICASDVPLFQLPIVNHQSPITNHQLSIEPHLRLIGADSVWNLRGYRGDSVVVGHIGSGINYNHLDLSSHMWNDPNYPNHGWNFELNNDNPIDVKGIGTYTAGAVAGDGTAGDTCGVAPKAQLMACRVKTSLGFPPPDTVAENQVFSAIEFCLSPPRSPLNGADIILITLSWRHSWNPRKTLWRQALSNAATSGVPFFVEAGNDRNVANPPDAIRTPGDVPGPWKHPSEQQGGLAGAITIGATDNLDRLASFSSPGPVTWQTIEPWKDYPYNPGPGLIKPDLVAPGVSIVSLLYNDNQGYGVISGTSMSASIAAGVAALMLSKNKGLSASELDSIMQMTTKPLGIPPKNNDYGTGRIRALSAVDAVPLFDSPQLLYHSSVIRDSSGNKNSQWDPGESIGLIDSIRNNGGKKATGVTGILRCTDSYITIFDSTGAWGDIDSQSVKANWIDTFALRARSDTPRGHKALFSLFLRANNGTYTTTVDFILTVGKILPSEPQGKDAYGYYAYDDLDLNYENSPTYNWVELNPSKGGTGIPVGPGSDDITYLVSFDQIGIKHYGKDFVIGSVCSNGWFAMDMTYQAFHQNTPLPSSQGTVPNLIAPLWDDLRTDSILGGTWWFLPDHTNNRFIIEWDSVPFFRNLNKRASFQILIYDTTKTPPTALTRDSEIIFQYKFIDETDSCTIGQQDSSKTIGLQSLFDGNYDPACFPIGRGRAIKFTTDPPRIKSTGIGLSKLGRDHSLYWVKAIPNPFLSNTTIKYFLPREEKVTLKIYNLLGQSIKTVLFEKEHKPGTYEVQWDGKDEGGNPVVSGIYFYRFHTDNFSTTKKLVVLR